MIAHLSIPARDPIRVGKVVAKLIDAILLPFPVVEGAVIALARDGPGFAVEVFPETVIHKPGTGMPVPGESTNGPSVRPWDFQMEHDATPPRGSAVHLALSTPLNKDEILALGAAEGWRCIATDRGGVFAPVELWLENRFLLEVMTREETERYRQFAQPELATRMFGSEI